MLTNTMTENKLGKGTEVLTCVRGVWIRMMASQGGITKQTLVDM